MKLWMLGWVVVFGNFVAPFEYCVTNSDSFQNQEPDHWNRVSIPAAWKEPPTGREHLREGYAWYRCAVMTPEAWSGHDLELYVEAVDDAREVYFNGVLIGGFGTFPPEFRSGLGHEEYFSIPSRLVLTNQPNLIAIRVFQNDARTNFNVAAPVLFGLEHAIRLTGDWEHRAGDDPQGSRRPEQIERLPSFSELADAKATRATLKQLDNEIGPLSPQQALTHFRTPEDLRVELALGDPDIGQPLSFKFDEHGRLWVVQYLQYPNPAGLTAVSRDKFLRTVYDRVPPAPPNHFRGEDKITIHEDRDGDGYFEEQQTFVDGLSLVSSFAFGRDGLWVLNPPYLLYYPDRDNDDRPDGDPEVHLAGFGIEDSHSIANSLRWGPDGWLYGAHGSTVTGSVKRPDSKQPPVRSLGQAIWRYHPELQRYEIFAEGGGNSFGVEFDSQGRIFSGHNGGDTRGFHFVQGGYYQKGFGKHGELSNPYTFGYFSQMQHHSVARFTHDLLIYEATALPQNYHGKMFGVAPLQGHITISERQPQGSSFRTRDVGHAWTTDDTWCRPVHLQTGPDGSIYVADFYEQRIDHASHYQGRVDRASGRIYRITAKAADGNPRDVIRPSFQAGAELLAALQSPNRWHRETALRIIAEIKSDSLCAPLRKLLEQNETPYPLDCLWALNAVGGLNDETALQLLSHPDPFVRLWTVRLSCDAGQVSNNLLLALIDLSMSEANVEVRSQLACSAKRLVAAQALPIIQSLLLHGEDLNDLHLPLLLWWAVEAKVSEDPAAVLGMFESTPLWQQPLVQHVIIERLMRRFAQSGSQRDLLACARLLRQAPEPNLRELLLKGFEAAFQGRSLAALPQELTQAMVEVGGGSLTLRLRLNDSAAVSEALQVLKDSQADPAIRIQLLEVLGDLRRPETIDSLLDIAQQTADDRVRHAALLTLTSFEEPSIATKLLASYKEKPPTEQALIQSICASRANWTLSFLVALEEGQGDATAVSAAILRRMSLHSDPKIQEKIQQRWGTLPGATTADMQTEIEKVDRLLATAAGNPYRGKQLYTANCGKCHLLFGEGQTVGPDLTNYQRDDLQRLLVHIINPSAEIREGYENTIVATNDGRVLSGFVVDQDNRVVVLRGASAETYVLSRDEIDDLSAVPHSLMPNGLLQSLTEQEIRDLFAYLRATQPLQ
ncbi:MAG: HEAT repeat domain-containing protein [Planctomycetaceae bacterium]|nr:HEAT repeat domain-containing protein [Planctomycetaceae bacterium]